MLSRLVSRRPQASGSRLAPVGRKTHDGNGECRRPGVQSAPDQGSDVERRLRRGCLVTRRHAACVRELGRLASVPKRHLYPPRLRRRRSPAADLQPRWRRSARLVLSGREADRLRPLRRGWKRQGALRGRHRRQPATSDHTCRGDHARGEHGRLVAEREQASSSRASSPSAAAARSGSSAPTGAGCARSTSRGSPAAAASAATRRAGRRTAGSSSSPPTRPRQATSTSPMRMAAASCKSRATATATTPVGAPASRGSRPARRRRGRASSSRSRSRSQTRARVTPRRCR